MKKYWKALTNIIITLILLLLIILLVPKMFVFFLPFVIGWIISLIAVPMVDFFEKKIKIKRKAGSAVVIVFVLAVVVLIVYLLLAKVVNEVGEIGKNLPDIWASWKGDFDEIGENLNSLYEKIPFEVKDRFENISETFSEYISGLITGIGTPTLGIVQNAAKSVPGIIVGVIMALLSAYFFVADRAPLYEWFSKHIPMSVQEKYFVIRESIRKAVGGYFKAQFKIEIWVYLELVIGLLILRVNYTFLVALGIALLDFLPIFGTGTVMVPWALIKLFSGDIPLAIGLLIVWGAGQLLRQLIQPKIVGASVGLEPIPTLIFLFVGFKIAGLGGMIIAVPLGMIFISMYREGTFDGTKDSILVLASGINNFRRLSEEDLSDANAMRIKDDKARMKRMDEIRTAEEARRNAQLAIKEERRLKRAEKKAAKNSKKK